MSTAGVLVLAAGVGIATYLLQPRGSGSLPNASYPTTSAASPSIAQVTDAVRSLRLITWSFDTTLDARSISDKWYGEAAATVRAPVRYQYGLDLDSLSGDDVVFDPTAAATT